MTGRLLSCIGGFYTVLGEDGARYTLRGQAKLRRQHEKPLAGDLVNFEPGEGDQHGWLTAVLPRRNMLTRPPVANIDVVALVVSAGYPESDLMLIDRMMMCARLSGIEPMLVVNKCDMDGGASEEIARQYARSGARVMKTCAVTGEGVQALREALSGKIYALSGQSGVGKSTLVNALYGFARDTGSLSGKIERGKNTTRQCELIPLPGGGGALDTPGFSLLDLPLMEPEKLKELVPEFAPCEGKCRFAVCLHRSEPGCAVRAQVEAGAIDPQRWARYKALCEEMDMRWRQRYG